jgi:hypothetical protein
MPMAQTKELKPPVKRFSFSPSNTIADLVRTVNELEKAGKPPFLKFVGYRGEISAIEILVEEERSELTLAGRDAIEEMAVAGAEDNGECLMPDPAEFTADSIVSFEGRSCRWGDLMIQDRKAYLSGGYPF